MLRFIEAHALVHTSQYIICIIAACIGDRQECYCVSALWSVTVYNQSVTSLLAHFSQSFYLIEWSIVAPAKKRLTPRSPKPIYLLLYYAMDVITAMKTKAQLTRTKPNNFILCLTKWCYTLSHKSDLFSFVFCPISCLFSQQLSYSL